MTRPLPADIAALRERVERGEGADDALDIDIARACYNGLCPDLVNYDPEMYVIRNGGWLLSLDAALALAEQLQAPSDPAWTWRSLLHVSTARAMHEQTPLSAMPRLVIAALLRALEEER